MRNHSQCSSFNIPSDRLASLRPRFRLSLLNFLMRWKRYEEALPIAEYLAANQPNGLLYRSSLAKILAALGRYEEASAIITELDYNYPNKPNTLAAAGDIEMARGDLPAALKRYLEMMKINEVSPKAWRRLAVLYLAANQPQKAYIYCQRIIDYYKKNSKGRKNNDDLHPDVLKVLAQVHRLSGDNKLASEIESKIAKREQDEEEQIRKELAAYMGQPKSAILNQPKSAILSQPNSTVLRQSNSAILSQPNSAILSQPNSTVLSQSNSAILSQPNSAILSQSHPAILSSSKDGQRHNLSKADISIPPLDEKVKICLKEVFGHNEFRIGQEETVARVLAGQDSLVIMPTGAGKSLCYQLPAALGKRVVVISPLIALMKDQVDGLPDALVSRATLINSSLDSTELERRMTGIIKGKYNLIYAAPERLRQAPFIHALRKLGIDLFVVDEVHCVSIWGHDFRPDYLFIGPALKLLDNPPFCGMTATAAPDMRKEIEERIGRRLVTVSIGTYRPNLRFEVKRVSKNADKLNALSWICHNNPGSGIIYANSRKKTKEIADYLLDDGIQAGYYHAGMTQDERTAAQEAFMSGKCRVIAATVAFGMGVDKRDVRFVVHYSLPKSLEGYYQEAGRAGRDNLPSRCVLLYSTSDKARLTVWTAKSQVRMDDLKVVYDSIKKLIPKGAGLIYDDDLRRETGLDETAVRVSVSLLERVGLIKRHIDVPVSVTLKVIRLQDTSPEFKEFVSSSRLREGQLVPMDAQEIASRTGIPLHELEWNLLGWRDNGWIAYRSSGRTMYIERPNPPRDSRKMLDEMLKSHRIEAERKLDQISAYATHSGCRHDFIARYFGEKPITGCTSCDNCACAVAPQRLRKEHMDVLKGIICLPIRLGRSGLIKALAGSKSCPIRPHEWPYLGKMSIYSHDFIGKLIDDLIDWGYIDRDGNTLRPLLILTPAGRKFANNIASDTVNPL